MTNANSSPDFVQNAQAEASEALDFGSVGRNRDRDRDRDRECDQCSADSGMISEINTDEFIV